MTRALAQTLRRRMSALEKGAWASLKTLRPEGIHVRRQHPVGRYSADFAIMRARLAIEIDGPLHEATKDADKQRDQYFANAGWRVLRITSAQLNDELAFLDLIRAGATPSPRGEGAGGGVKHETSKDRGDSAKSAAPAHRPAPQPPPLTGRGSGPARNEPFPPELERRTRANRKLMPRSKKAPS